MRAMPMSGQPSPKASGRPGGVPVEALHVVMSVEAGGAMNVVLKTILNPV